MDKSGLVCQEVPWVFSCGDEHCVGVLSDPIQTIPSDLAVVIVVGGPQYRVGSHRQFVVLARGLASAGHPTLRFDYRGMGDSSGPMRDFQQIDEDIRRAIDCAYAHANPSGVVLWGLCDGASAAMMYAPSDTRVKGIVAVNPWVRSDTGLATARVKHYYAQRLLTAEFWRKLLSGQVFVLRGLMEAACSLWLMLRGKFSRSRATEPAADVPHFLDRMHRHWLAFTGPTLLLLSGNDLTAQEFTQWTSADSKRAAHLRDNRVVVRTLAQADHTFSKSAWMCWTIERTVEWLNQIRLARP